MSSGSVVNDSSRAFGTFESFFSGGAAKRFHCTPIESTPGRCITVTGPKIDVVRFAAIVLYFYIITFGSGVEDSWIDEDCASTLNN